MRISSLTIALVLACALARPSVVQAHAILMESQPAANAAVAPGAIALSLRFNSRIDAERSRVTLIGPRAQASDTRAGAEAILPIIAAGSGEIIVATATLAPGFYLLRWQVLAVDGHITRGETRFSVTPGK